MHNFGPKLSEDPTLEEEVAFYKPAAKAETEKVTGESFRQHIETSFYLDKKPPHVEDRLWLHRKFLYGEITGCSGSGKHSIERAVLSEMMTSKLPPELTATDTELLSYIDFVMAGKNHLAAERRGSFHDAAKENAGLTEIGYFRLLGKMRESDQRWILSTMGPLSTFNIMAYYHGREFIPSFIAEHKLRDTIYQSPTVTALADHISDDLLTEGLDMLATVAEKVRRESLFNMCPIYDTQRPIIYVCGLPIEVCNRNRGQESTSRSAPRRYQSDLDEFQIQTRLVEAIMLKLRPEEVIEINTTLSSDFASAGARKVLTVGTEIISSNIGIPVVNPSAHK